MIVMLICVAFVPVCSARSRRGKAKRQRISVSKLLDKYAQTQEKLQSSFVIKSELVTDDSQRRGRVYETRCDGNQIFWVEKHWGTKVFVAGKERMATKESPSYLYCMFGGEFMYSHSRGLDRLGTVLISTEKKPRTDTLHNSPERYFVGYCYGNYDRIDQVLRRYDNTQLDHDMEKVGSYNCYHIQSKTKEGAFNVWISPELDYNIVKMNASYKEGDIFYGVSVPETGKIIWQAEISDFKRVDGVWVPMEVTSRLNRRIPARHHKIIEKDRRKRTEVILNPDHEKLNSFGTDFIPNGAKTYIVSIDPDYRYIWQDGKLIPDTPDWLISKLKIDKAVISELNKVAAEISAQKDGSCKVVDKNGRTVMDCLKKPKGNKK